MMTVENLTSQLLRSMLEKIDARDRASLVEELAERMHIEPSDVELIAEEPSEMFIREPFRLAVVAGEIGREYDWKWPEFWTLRAQLEEAARVWCPALRATTHDLPPLPELISGFEFQGFDDWANDVARAFSLEHHDAASSELAYQARLHDVSLLERKAELLATALGRTIEDRHRVQKVRLGSRAEVRFVIPAELPPEELRHWCESAAKRDVIEQLAASAGVNGKLDPDCLDRDALDSIADGDARPHPALSAIGEDDEAPRIATTAAEQAALEDAGHLCIRLNERELDQCDPSFRDFVRRLSAAQAIVVLARAHSRNWEEVDQKLGKKPGYSRDIARRIRRAFPQWLAADWAE
jgi:hypothetical protein